MSKKPLDNKSAEKLLDRVLRGNDNRLRTYDQGYWDTEHRGEETTVAWQRKLEGGWLLYAAWNKKGKEVKVCFETPVVEADEALAELRKRLVAELS